MKIIVIGGYTFLLLELSILRNKATSPLDFESMFLGMKQELIQNNGLLVSI